MEQIECLIGNPPSKCDAAGNGVSSIIKIKEQAAGFNGVFGSASYGQGKCQNNNSLQLELSYRQGVNLFVIMALWRSVADLYALRKYYDTDNETIKTGATYHDRQSGLYANAEASGLFMNKKTTGMTITGMDLKRTSYSIARWLNTDNVADSVNLKAATIAELSGVISAPM